MLLRRHLPAAAQTVVHPQILLELHKAKAPAVYPVLEIQQETAR